MIEAKNFEIGSKQRESSGEGRGTGLASADPPGLSSVFFAEEIRRTERRKIAGELRQLLDSTSRFSRDAIALIETFADDLDGGR